MLTGQTDTNYIMFGSPLFLSLDSKLQVPAHGLAPRAAYYPISHCLLCLTPFVRPLYTVAFNHPWHSHWRQQVQCLPNSVRLSTKCSWNLKANLIH